MCQKAEKAGASWITVHGRTKEQRAQPVNLEAIKIIKDSLQCPVIANGDIKSLEDAEKIAEFTGVNGQLHEYCQFEDFNRYKYVYLFHFI